jgi:AcrR family transcriptional regulator
LKIVDSWSGSVTSDYWLVYLPIWFRELLVKDRRQDIINASMAVLRESGYSGFTQPRVSAKVGLRQSHLTYYFPTRVDLLAGVARVAIDRQLAAVDGVLGASSVGEAAEAIAHVAVRHENTRVIMALVQAADQEPALRELFRELADGKEKDDERYELKCIDSGRWTSGSGDGG